LQPRDKRKTRLLSQQERNRVENNSKKLSESIARKGTLAVVTIFELEQREAQPGWEPHAQCADRNDQVATVVDRFDMPVDFFLTVAAIKKSLIFRHDN
jgi:hypothetical protein